MVILFLQAAVLTWHDPSRSAEIGHETALQYKSNNEALKYDESLL